MNIENFIKIKKELNSLALNLNSYKDFSNLINGYEEFKPEEIAGVLGYYAANEYCPYYLEGHENKSIKNFLGLMKKEGADFRYKTAVYIAKNMYQLFQGE